MSDHNELIAQFVSMTSATESQAQFYLEMSDWNLEVNRKLFYVLSVCTDQRSFLGCCYSIL